MTRRCRTLSSRNARRHSLTNPVADPDFDRSPPAGSGVPSNAEHGVAVDFFNTTRSTAVSGKRTSYQLQPLQHPHSSKMRSSFQGTDREPLLYRRCCKAQTGRFWRHRYRPNETAKEECLNFVRSRVAPPPFHHAIGETGEWTLTRVHPLVSSVMAAPWAIAVLSPFRSELRS